jgi:hypothetical protein
MNFVFTGASNGLLYFKQYPGRTKAFLAEVSTKNSANGKTAGTQVKKAPVNSSQTKSAGAESDNPEAVGLASSKEATTPAKEVVTFASSEALAAEIHLSCLS